MMSGYRFYNIKMKAQELRNLCRQLQHPHNHSYRGSHDSDEIERFETIRKECRRRLLTSSSFQSDWRLHLRCFISIGTSDTSINWMDRCLFEIIERLKIRAVARLGRYKIYSGF